MYNINNLFEIKGCKTISVLLHNESYAFYKTTVIVYNLTLTFFFFNFYTWLYFKINNNILLLYSFCL